MMRKYKKMELMNKENILRERELDYADVYIDVTERLSKLVSAIGINQLRLICSNYVERTFRDKGIPFSIIGRNNATERIMGMISMYKSLNDIEKNINDLKQKHSKNKITQEEFEHGAHLLKDVGDETVKAIDLQLDEWHRYSLLHKQYNDFK